MYLDTCDCNNSATLIGAVVGVICLVILIMVISNIMIWIYCFRKKHHTGMYVCSYIRMYIATDIKLATKKLASQVKLATILKLAK